MHFDADKPSSFSKSGIVRIVVGKSETQFEVHKDLLITKSAFFRAALTSSFPEAETNVINLPEDKVQVVQHFINWLHDKSLTFQLPEGMRTESSEVYRFADKIAVKNSATTLWTRSGSLTGKTQLT